MFKKCPDAQVNHFPENESRLFAIGFGEKAAENGGIPLGRLVHTGGVASSILAAPTNEINGLHCTMGRGHFIRLNPLIYG